jgi:hypothetical protein
LPQPASEGLLTRSKLALIDWSTVHECHTAGRSLNHRRQRCENAKADPSWLAEGESPLIEGAVLDKMNAMRSPGPYFIEPKLA